MMTSLTVIETHGSVSCLVAQMTPALQPVTYARLSSSEPSLSVSDSAVSSIFCLTSRSCFLESKGVQSPSLLVHLANMESQVVRWSKLREVAVNVRRSGT